MAAGGGRLKADPEEIEELARHFSEWTDDTAPLRMGEYRQAAAAWFDKKEAAS